MNSTILTIIIAIISSGTATTLIKFFVQRKDDKVFKEGGEILDAVNDHVVKVNERMDKLEKALLEHVDKHSENIADTSRQRILRFSDDIYNGCTFTKEHYETILMDIDKYAKYCDDHPGYKNEKCTAAIGYIKKNYDSNLKERTFKEYK